MREIKFRGKRIDNGELFYGLEWVYGDLLQSYCDDKAHIDNNHCFDLMHISANKPIEVEKETVGQFTGLLDKNGKEIYEGDIVRDQWNSYTPIYQNAIYMAYNVDKINDPYVSTQFNVIWRNGCEVIGNIHDNLELLEVKQ